jgi:hypothetical protein
MILRAMLVGAYGTGRTSHARQVKGDDPDKKGYSGPPGWGLGVRLTTSPCKKKLLLRNLKRRPRPTQGCRANDDEYHWHLVYEEGSPTSVFKHCIPTLNMVMWIYPAYYCI